MPAGVSGFPYTAAAAVPETESSSGSAVDRTGPRGPGDKGEGESISGVRCGGLDEVEVVGEGEQRVGVTGWSG